MYASTQYVRKRPYLLLSCDGKSFCTALRYGMTHVLHALANMPDALSTTLHTLRIRYKYVYSLLSNTYATANLQGTSEPLKVDGFWYAIRCIVEQNAPSTVCHLHEQCCNGTVESATVMKEDNDHSADSSTTSACVRCNRAGGGERNGRSNKAVCIWNEIALICCTRGNWRTLDTLLWHCRCARQVVQNETLVSRCAQDRSWKCALVMVRHAWRFQVRRSASYDTLFHQALICEAHDVCNAMLEFFNAEQLLTVHQFHTTATTPTIGRSRSTAPIGYGAMDDTQTLSGEAVRGRNTENGSRDTDAKQEFAMNNGAHERFIDNYEMVQNDCRHNMLRYCSLGDTATVKSLLDTYCRHGGVKFSHQYENFLCIKKVISTEDAATLDVLLSYANIEEINKCLVRRFCIEACRKASVDVLRVLFKHLRCKIHIEDLFRISCKRGYVGVMQMLLQEYAKIINVCHEKTDATPTSSSPSCVHETRNCTAAVDFGKCFKVACTNNSVCVAEMLVHNDAVAWGKNRQHTVRMLCANMLNEAYVREMSADMALFLYTTATDRVLNEHLHHSKRETLYLLACKEHNVRLARLVLQSLSRFSSPFTVLYAVKADFVRILREVIPAKSVSYDRRVISQCKQVAFLSACIAGSLACLRHMIDVCKLYASRVTYETIGFNERNKNIFDVMQYLCSRDLIAWTSKGLTMFRKHLGVQGISIGEFNSYLERARVAPVARSPRTKQ